MGLGGVELKVISNRDGAKWVEITKALLLFKPYDKTRFWRPSLGIKRAFGLRLMCNCRFMFFKGSTRTNWLIRLPFLYWEKTNMDWKFGTTGLYLWWHIART